MDTYINVFPYVCHKIVPFTPTRRSIQDQDKKTSLNNGKQAILLYSSRDKSFVWSGLVFPWSTSMSGVNSSISKSRKNSQSCQISLNKLPIIAYYCCKVEFSFVLKSPYWCMSGVGCSLLDCLALSDRREATATYPLSHIGWKPPTP